MEGFKDAVAGTILGDGKLHGDVPVWTKEEIPGQVDSDQGTCEIVSDFRVELS